MKKYYWVNKFIVILLIYGIFMGYSISYAENETENVMVEEEVSTPPVTDKSIERTYDAQKGMYRYALSKNTVFSSSVPNGVITNGEVYIDISDKVAYSFTRNGEKYNYSRGESIDEDGVYKLTVTVNNTSDLKFDFSNLNFSLDSLDGMQGGENETEQITETKNSEVTVTDEAWGLANGTVFEFKFRIINKACNNINIFNLPQDYAFESIIFDENNIENVKKLNSFSLNDDGKYVFSIYDTKNPKKKFTTEIILKTNLPILKIQGVVNGLTTYDSVVIDTYESDVTYTATCNGETIRPYGGAFSEAGLYSVKAKDEAGNTNEYTFRILYTMNLSSGTVIAIVVIIIISLVGYVVYLKKHMRVY